MRISLFLFFLLFNCVLVSARANVNHHFDHIKTNPNALYAFLKKMPKGGELHYHLAGGAYPEIMLALAVHGNYCLNPHTNTITKTELCEGIKTSNIVKNSDVYSATVRAWSMQDFIPGQESAHDHFFASFFKFMPIVVDSRPQLLASIMRRAADQNEQYLEIMILPDNGVSTTFAPLANKQKNFAAKQQSLLANKHFQANVDLTVTETHRILQAARHDLGCDTKPRQKVCSITVKFQYYVLREQPLDKVFAQALNGFVASSHSKEIVGVNLVQAEDGPISLRDYKAQMRIFKFLHKTYPTVNIALHAGELAPPYALAADLKFHIHDAIFTGQAKRIGHGVDIIHEQDEEALLKYMANTPIPIEINLTSNRKILNVFGKQHPLLYYLSHQVPVILSSDDEGILRTDLTSEYVEAVLNYHLDYATLKSINRNALTYSFLPGKSLWADPNKHLPIPQCNHLKSIHCRHFLKTNQKAQLQWELENKLTAFEESY